MRIIIGWNVNISVVTATKVKAVIQQYNKHRKEWRIYGKWRVGKRKFHVKNIQWKLKVDLYDNKNKTPLK